MTIDNLTNPAIYGHHAIIDCRGDVSKLSPKQTEHLMLNAADAAGATVLNCHAHSFGDGCGYTILILLSESHISVHTWPESGFAAFDIFMCGSKDNLLKAVDVLKGFDPDGEYTVRVLERGRLE